MQHIRTGVLASTALAVVLGFAAAPPAAAQQRSSTRAAQAQPPRIDLAAPLKPVAGDPAVAEKLRELLADRTRIERIIPRRTERDAVIAFYDKSRGFGPMWIDAGAETERAKTAIAHLRGVDADTLDPADYPVPQLAADTPAAQAEAELRLTASLLTYARHAMDGRLHWSRLAHDIDYKDFDAVDALGQIGRSDDLKRTLDGFNPPHAAYRALRAKYAELRAAPAEGGPARIESGPVLKYARDKKGVETLMSDARVPLVRERLRMAAEPGEVYNRALADAVTKFQRARGLTANGQLTDATVKALNPPDRQDRLEAVAANLERWRWVPRDLGRTHVMLNIPDYHLRVMNNGQQVWMTRVVVGKPTHATPLISSTMRHITVNPYWNVPQSIIYNELLPAYERSGPSAFARQGLKVEQRPDGIRVFQPPGDRNALGRLRFNFNNKFLVYHHDTPEKALFAHERRAYSHGCMRVMNPVKYAEVLLSLALPRGNYTQDAIKRMFGPEEKDIQLPVGIAVHLTYQTAFVDDAGALQFRDDVYGLDRKMTAQLKGDQRAVADVAVARPADPNFQPTAEHRQKLQNVARGSAPTPAPARAYVPFDTVYR